MDSKAMNGNPECYIDADAVINQSDEIESVISEADHEEKQRLIKQVIFSSISACFSPTSTNRSQCSFT